MDKTNMQKIQMRTLIRYLFHESTKKIENKKAHSSQNRLMIIHTNLIFKWKKWSQLHHQQLGNSATAEQCEGLAGMWREKNRARLGIFMKARASLQSVIFCSQELLTLVTELRQGTAVRLQFPPWRHHRTEKLHCFWSYGKWRTFNVKQMTSGGGGGGRSRIWGNAWWNQKTGKGKVH